MRCVPAIFSRTAIRAFPTSGRFHKHRTGREASAGCHGSDSFDYTVAEAAIQQGCPPDTISSDIHAFSGNTPGRPYLTWVMSKFMGLGFSLEKVVAMATINPAKIINRAPKLGTLQPGAPGDVAIMELVEGPVSFVDTRNNTRNGQAYLKPVQTVTAGIPFGRPYNAPFAVR